MQHFFFVDVKKRNQIFLLDKIRATKTRVMFVSGES